MNCRYLSWTLSQFNSRNSLTQILDILPLTCIYFALIEVLILVSLKYFESKLCRHKSKRGCISVLHKSLRKRGVEKRFCLCRNFRREFILSITFNAIVSPEILQFKIHPRYFTFTYCLISMPLHTIFKNLAFRSFCLVPSNIDFILSCPKCILNLLSTIQSHTLEKSLISCFSNFSFAFILENYISIIIYVKQKPKIDR